jgi:transcriptional regulator with XRE-family HTH domain
MARRDSWGSAEPSARATHGAPYQTMTSQNGRAFNEWLRAQLKAKKMSQRQLAQQSGVDHSTISRLIRGDRMPSLGTATKLARGLRELREDADTAQYLGLVTAGAMNPTARVEYALRADEMLSEPQVRQIMEYYLAVRMRRFGRAFQPTEGSQNRPPDRPLARSQPSIGGPVVAGVGQATDRMSNDRMSNSRPIGRPMGRQGRP